MQSSAVSCKLCGGDVSDFSERNGFAIVKCRRCGFMFAPLPAGFDLNAVYRDDAYWSGGTNCGYQNYDDEWKASERFYRARLARLKKLSKPGRLLEVGCAAGFFLEAARRDRWDVAGTEISDSMRQRCAERAQCPVFASIDEVAASGQRFDCVAMFEVIEHVTDPLALLRQVRELIVPGGLLALSTPNFEGPEAARNPGDYHWFAPPVHISYFGPATLSSCVREAGFAVLAMEGLLGQEEPPLPAPLAAILAPLRRGKRLRPRGLLGRLLRLYQRRRKDVLRWANGLDLYARKI
ncbi:MAG TPA: class I SAM-dependent methyltransferase [Candidatus Binataceae bacterium]|nr:class I SAM-dependent methyltransferase [Candidatus Binataceae bacterium]